MTGPLPTVVYVGGYSRSGSTLLDVMLSSALGAVGGGELCRLLEDWSTGHCSCGHPYPACPFWRGLDLDERDRRQRAARRVEGRVLMGRFGRVGRIERDLHRDTIRRVFSHVRRLSDAEVVIDSSKTARAAARRPAALADAGLDVRYVHLVRSPYGVADSYARIGSNRAHESGEDQPRVRVPRAAVGWVLANRAADGHRGDRRWRSTVVAYEDLVRDPETVLGRVIADLGLAHPDRGLSRELGDARGHAVAGNRMRRSDGVVVERGAVAVIPPNLSVLRRLTVRSVVALGGDRGYRSCCGAIPTSPGASLGRLGGGGPRVVHLCTRFAGGGSERRIVDAVAATPDADHVLFAGPESDPARMAADLPGVDVWIVPGLDSRAFTPRRDLMAVRVLAGALRAASPDVIHTVQSKAGVLGRLCAPARARRVHSVSMLNFGPAFAGPVSRLSRAVEKVLVGRTDQLLVAGTDLRDEYVASGIGTRDDYVVVRARFALESATRWRNAAKADARRVFGLPADQPVVAFIGRMEDRKGVGDLAPILAGVIATEPNTVIALAGQGPRREDTVGSLRSLGAAVEVAELGRVEDVLGLLRGADCVLLPSRTEGMPQVLVQASAVGTPFVAFDVPGVREILALGAIGTVVEPGDLAAASAAVLRWLRDGGLRGDVDLSSWAPHVVEGTWRSVLLAAGRVLP